MNFDRRIAIITFLVGVVSLTYELLQVRMLAFFLGKSMDFLAIPIALLGLALGSMLRHFVLRGDAKKLLDRLCISVFPLMLFSFVTFFFVANRFFSEIHVAVATPATEALKVVAYGAIFLPPYLAFGGLFSTLFTEFSDQIGRLYFYDLAGAGLGCVLAPVLLTRFGLPPAILFTLLLALALLVVPRETPKPVRAGGLMLWVVTAMLAIVGVLFVETPDSRTLARSVIKKQRVEQVDVRWNEIARTALMHGKKDGGRWAIVQDNGLSNVTVQGWSSSYRDDAIDRYGNYGTAWRLGQEPTEILVIFAGMGRDMMGFNELARGKAHIVGVELNRTVVEWANHPALAKMNIPAFHALDHIDLRNEEGRDFLNTDTGTYDLIYLANNGAVHAGRTGHTRKFLDTYEAMEAYLDKLNPGGIILFNVQPVMEKIPSFRKLLAERGGPPASESILVWGENHPNLDSMLVKPDGISKRDILAIEKMLQKRRSEMLYQPGAGGQLRLQSLFEKPVDSLHPVTDDKPFLKRVEWENFTVLPDPTQYRDGQYVSGWVKMFTILLFGTVCLGVGGVATLAGRASQRVPALWVGYLLLTGIGYMCIEIPLIAKTELFIGNPLYAVSINLAIFLLFNAVGSWLQDEYRIMRNGFSLALGVVLSVAWGLGTVETMTQSLLSASLGVKAIGVAIIVLPVAVVVGMFYPYCVRRLVQSDQGECVPMTYGLTTLSSVLGSAFAMTAIINLGFTNVIGLGTALYVIAAAVTLLHGRR